MATMTVAITPMKETARERATQECFPAKMAVVYRKIGSAMGIQIVWMDWMREHVVSFQQ